MQRNRQSDRNKEAERQTTNVRFSSVRFGAPGAPARAGAVLYYDGRHTVTDVHNDTMAMCGRLVPSSTVKRLVHQHSPLPVPLIEIVYDFARPVLLCIANYENFLKEDLDPQQFPWYARWFHFLRMMSVPEPQDVTKLRLLIWDLDRREVVNSVVGYFNSAVPIGDGLLATFDIDDDARRYVISIFSAVTGKAVSFLRGHTGMVRCVISLSVSADTGSKTTSNTLPASAPGTAATAHAASLSSLLASCSDDGSIRVWHTLSGKCICILKEKAKIRRLASVSDNRLVSGGLPPSSSVHTHTQAFFFRRSS